MSTESADVNKGAREVKKLRILYNQGPRYDFENGGGHIREAARFTITLGANKISNFKGK